MNLKYNQSGQDAEVKVAEYLSQKGFKILDRNWKTPKCEIDIVAKKNNCIYFVEVKYRKNDNQGDGYSYITKTKIKQMSYSAEIWVAKNKWENEYCLAGASVSGKDFQIDFIEEL